MKKGYLLLLLSLIFVACTQNPTDIDKPALLDGKIYATISDGADDNSTRVQLNDQMQTVWNKGDKITIFGPNEYAEYSFDGETGDRAGIFSVDETFEPIKDKVSKFYAVYPAVGFVDYASTTAANYELITRLPDVQTYVKGSYSPNANVMFGSSNDGSSYSFKNMVAYLCLKLTSSSETPKFVKSIDVLGNNDEIMAGRMYINTNTGVASFRGDDVTTSNKITLDCGEAGVELSATPTEFYVVIPGVEFSKGITVCVNFTDGSTFPRSTMKKINFRPNYIQPMAVFSTDATDVAWQYAYIEHNGDIVAMPQLAGSSVMSGCVIWGDGIVSMLGGDVDYRYQDDVDEHTITVQVTGATELKLNHCTGISSIDLSNF